MTLAPDPLEILRREKANWLPNDRTAAGIPCSSKLCDEERHCNYWAKTLHASPPGEVLMALDSSACNKVEIPVGLSLSNVRSLHSLDKGTGST